MKQAILIVILAISAALLVPAQGTDKKESRKGTNQDEEAIKRAIANWDKGWKEFDARLATQDYAEDADWINAFGRARKGRAEIQRFFTDTFAAPEMRSRRSTPSTSSIRFVRPDVALISSSRETVGQKTASGGEYPTRKTHDLRVMVKDKGKWVIASHQIMDEKEVRQ